jgi:O-acetyl-ADP-ribose deacetylase (regulator of RNase III)
LEAWIDDMNQVLKESLLATGATLQLVQGDLTEERVDVIVNAANAHLQHGGGVAGAISRRGGSKIQAESDAWVRAHGPVPHAQPAYTGAGRLPCRYVIHAVGPVWGEGEEDKKLHAAVYGTLELADQLSLTSIAFPAISTGIFGFPKERAARIMLETIRSYFVEQPGSKVRLVRIVLIDSATVAAFSVVWDTFWSDKPL